MSSPVSTVDDAPAAAGQREAAASEAGWRTGGLPALRAELDRIDDAVHDLLIQRGEIVEYVARSGKPAAFRPGREASILRRLLGRHHGALPPVAICRIWRELLAGTTSMQGGFSLAVCESDDRASVTQLAREHFGALTPLQVYGSPREALADVGGGLASAAVLPYPSETVDWWVRLPKCEPRLHVIGRLPFWRQRPTGAPALEALVVAATQSDPSGDDRSLLDLECDGSVTLAQLSSELSRVGLTVETLVARRQESSTLHVMADVGGYLADGDLRLGNFGGLVGRPIVLGNYAMPYEGNRR